MGSWEQFDHTGDVGLRVRGDGLEDLFVAAARGLYDLLVETGPIRPQREDQLVVESERTDELLRAWLAELLYRFSAEGMIFGEFHLAVEPTRLTARLRGEAFDAARHRLRTELKAVTYHGLFARREKNGWIAEIIFDI